MVATGVISELSGNERLTEHNDVKAASTTYPSAVQLQVIGVSVVTFTLLLSAIFATTAVPLDMSEMPYSQVVATTRWQVEPLFQGVQNSKTRHSGSNAQ